MSYIVLARKWRPAQFSDIVGQSPVVRTFMNAIKLNRIHQAYLFTGSRGVGKTSIARIFSKALRCENTSWSGEWLNSCGVCSNCKEISAGSSVDVLEIDGASNNGVDAIREIRENVKYLPSSGTRKIYIIDEVHMLTTAAFNALLKTLEEPPEHVIFVFATTEPHKIPMTILSRCQRFDFKRVTPAQIQSRLEFVCTEEKIAFDPAALALIAKAAEGSMRDALSILDQVIAFAGERISVEQVRESTGMIGNAVLFGILSAVLGRKPHDAMQFVFQAYQQGHDLKVLTRSLIELMHATILVKVAAPEMYLSEFTIEEREELKKLAALRELEELELIFQALNQGVDWIARAPQPKIVLDVLLIKCATAEALVSIDSDETSNEAPHATAAASEKKPAQTAATPARVTAPTSTPQVFKSATEPSSPIMNARASTATPAQVQPTSSSMTPRSWEGFIAAVRTSRPLLATILEHGSCALMPTETSNELVLCFKTEESYYIEQLQTKLYSDELNQNSRNYFGRMIQIRFESRDDVESLAAQKYQREENARQQAIASVKNHPIIREAQSVLGGELGAINLISSEGSSNAR